MNSLNSKTSAPVNDSSPTFLGRPPVFELQIIPPKKTKNYLVQSDLLESPFPIHAKATSPIVVPSVPKLLNSGWCSCHNILPALPVASPGEGLVNYGRCMPPVPCNPG